MPTPEPLDPVDLAAIDLRAPAGAQEQALAAMLVIPPVADELGRRFAAAGFALHLVGGSVRDLLLAGPPAPGGAPVEPPDLDFTTDARPEQVLGLVRGWAEAVWDVGVRFGTVGVQRHGTRLEITTYRAESYSATSRKPEVTYGDDLADDLVRRDFSVNAMAVSVPGHVFVDPYGGLRDLAAGVLRTPGPPERSFTDDPLRILRAARFTARLGLRPTPEVTAAMRALAGRLGPPKVAVERVRGELEKLMLGPDPVPGLELLVETGVAEQVLPELPRLRMAQESDRQHKDVYAHTLAVLRNAIGREGSLPGGGPDLVLRLAALLHDIGKPDTRKIEPGGVSFHFHEVVGARMARDRLRALGFPKQVVADVEKLVKLHLRFHGYGPGTASPWTDSAVRRYVTASGPLLDRLHALVRSDSTTRNARKAAALQRAYDALEARIAALREQEEVDAIRPDLSGEQIMAALGVPPGPLVGRAYRHLLELRTERGPQGEAAATRALLEWAAEQGVAGQGLAVSDPQGPPSPDPEGPDLPGSA